MKRLKRRYMALRLDAEAVPSEGEFVDAVWAAVVRLYGEYGASQTSLAPISFDAQSRLAVLRANLAFVDCVRVALASLTSVAGKPIAVHVLAVSGTIKALRAGLSF